MRINSEHAKAVRFLADTDVKWANAVAAATVRDLEELGLLGTPNRMPSVLPSFAFEDGDRRLLALLECFGLEVDIWPAMDGVAFVALAIWEPRDSDTTTRGAIFSGTGFQPMDALRACLGEFAEFQSWLYRSGDAAIRCNREALSPRALDPWLILGLAPTEGETPVSSGATLEFDPPPPSHTFAGAIDWSEVRDLLDGTCCWLPTQLCYGRYAERESHASSAWGNDSNGCAAGITRGHAERSAVLELIERDATGIWWYGQHRRPALDPAQTGSGPLLAALRARNKMGQNVRLINLTHDLRVPVAAAVLLNGAGTLEAVGFGCHGNAGHAMVSAYLEMCQMEISIALVRQRAKRAGAKASANDLRLLAWLAQADLRRLPHLAPSDPAHDLRDVDIGDLLGNLHAAGLRAYGLDLARADIGIPALRVFIPGLCHYKPRLNQARLISTPIRLKWRASHFSAADLSAIPLLI